MLDWWDVRRCGRIEWTKANEESPTSPFGPDTMDDIAWLEGKQVRERARRRRNMWWASIIFPQVGTHFGIWPKPPSFYPSPWSKVPSQWSLPCSLCWTPSPNRWEIQCLSFPILYHTRIHPCKYFCETSINSQRDNLPEKVTLLSAGNKP